MLLNPVRANVVKKPAEWPWSSYKATAGVKPAPELLTIDWILGLFGKDKAEAQKLYRKFVRAGIGIKSPWGELHGQILLGEETFIEKCKDFLSDKEIKKEIPKLQRYLKRPRLSRVFEKVKTKDDRDNRIYTAHVKYGYTMKEIADALSLHYSTASEVVKAKEEKK